MKQAAPSSNGLPFCLHEPEHIVGLAKQLERLNELIQERERAMEKEQVWVKDYIDRTMPIRSHFWILIGSLSVLSAFAAAIKYIEKLNL